MENLPPSILNLLAYWLEADSVIKLAFFCGCTQLQHKMTRGEGVTELRAGSKASLAPLFFFPQRFLLFNRLIRLNVYNPEYISRALPVMPIWTSQLPPTLVEIRVKDRNAFSIWIREVDYTSDPASLSEVKLKFGLEPASMQDLFPQLQVLQLEGASPCSPYDWDNYMFDEFKAHLPTTLTESHLKCTHQYDLYPPALDNLSALSVALSQWQPFLDSATPFLPTVYSTPMSISDAHLPIFGVPFTNLRTLNVVLQGYFEPDSRDWTCFAQLSCLETLKLEAQGGYPSIDKYPASLTVLSTRISMADSMKTLLGDLHMLHTLDAHLEAPDDDQGASAFPTVDYLPPSITKLRLEGVFYGRVDPPAQFHCVFPPKLTELSLKDMGSSDTHPLPYSQLTSLTKLYIDRPPVDITKLRLPASLTMLIENLAQPCEHLGFLPKTLRHWEGPIVLGSREAFTKQQTKLRLTFPALRESLRQYYCPFLPADGFSPSIHLLSGFARGMEERRGYIEYEAHEKLRSLSDLPLQSQVVRFVAPSMDFGIAWTPKQLPDHLEELEVDNMQWMLPGLLKHERGYFYTPASNRIPNRSGLSFPSSLRSLKLSSLELYKEEKTYTLTLCPFLPSTISTLHLSRLSASFPPGELLCSLPDSLTDLLVRFYCDKKNIDQRYSIPKERFPLLRKLELDSCDVPLQDVLHKVHQLEHLAILEILVKSPELPSFESGQGPELTILNDVALQQHCLRLLPVHLRNPLVSSTFKVEWDQESLLKLPRRLHKAVLTLPKCDDFSLHPHDLGQHLPPTLVELDLSEYMHPHFWDVQYLPSTLRALNIWMTKVDANTILSLPRTLLSFDLDVAQPNTHEAWSIKYSANLPPQLQYLNVNGLRVDSKAERSFPASLRSVVFYCDTRLEDAHNYYFTSNPADEHRSDAAGGTKSRSRSVSQSFSNTAP